VNWSANLLVSSTFLTYIDLVGMPLRVLCGTFELFWVVGNR
jgi:hypothetical protein